MVWFQGLAFASRARALLALGRVDEARKASREAEARLARKRGPVSPSADR